MPILNHQITRPTPLRIELPHESPLEAVPPSSDTHPVPQDTPEPLADESIAEPASPPHDIVSEEKSTSAPPTLPIPDVKNIPSPARVIQPESPKPCENQRPKRKIVPPAPAVTALYTILFMLFHALLCHFVYHPLNEIHVKKGRSLSNM